MHNQIHYTDVSKLCESLTDWSIPLNPRFVYHGIANWDADSEVLGLQVFKRRVFYLLDPLPAKGNELGLPRVVIKVILFLDT